MNRHLLAIHAALALALPAPAVAQHKDHAATRDSLPAEGSGTAWLPQPTPRRGVHLALARWRIMIHGNVFAQFIREPGPRGNWQIGSVNWVMARADHPLAGGTVGLRAMVSGEFLTLTRAGYPALLQVAQPYRGATLPDRMHPHELVGEAALTYQRAVLPGLGASLYLAAAGEPALGPVAYLHRPSAEHDPIAPLAHHAQDETHERFGVATLGVFTRRVQFEFSAFNGNHPDDVRTNLELSGGRLNSFSTRVTVNPAAQWSLSASAGFLAASGGSADHLHGALHRYVLAITSVRPRAAGVWASTLVWGANAPIGSGRMFPSVLLESNFDVNGRSALFGRLEYAARSADELNLTGSISEQVALGSAAVGYARELASWRALSASIGGRAQAYLLPDQLRLFYGGRVLLGLAGYLQLRPR